MLMPLWNIWTYYGTLQIENIPVLAVTSKDANTGRLDWTILTEEEINRYSTVTDNLLNNIELPSSDVS